MPSAKAITNHDIINVYLWWLFFLIVIFYLFIYLFLYLFLAVLDLRFCARAFSSCGKQGPLFIVVRGPLHHRGLSCCGAQAPDAQAQQLWLTGLVAPRHVGSSQTRARTRIPCIGRQTLNHCATREAPYLPFSSAKISARNCCLPFRSHNLTLPAGCCLL